MAAGTKNGDCEPAWSVWRQGHLIPMACNAGVLSVAVDHRGGLDTDQIRLVVISQDCDVVHPDRNKEPYLELIAAKVIARADGNFTKRKNPRRLHLTVNDRHLDFDIHRRLRVPKTCLTAISEICPDHELQVTGSALEILRLWIADRYIRSAFPDEFNRRLALKKKSQQLEVFFATHTAAISEVFFATIDQELAATAPYELKVILTYAEDPSPKVHEIARELENILNDCPGIKAEVEWHSEDDMTLRLLRTYKRVHLDQFSSPE